MPRYKAKCPCKTEFWVRKTVKLDDLQKSQLTHRSLCAACAAIYRRRFLDVQYGQFSGAVTPEEQQQLDSLLSRLRENHPWGFTQQPFRMVFATQMMEDRKTVTEGITTRYRGYSPTREMLRLRYRLLVAQWALAQVTEEVRS